jgi:hypothetical protein
LKHFSHWNRSLGGLALKISERIGRPGKLPEVLDSSKACAEFGTIASTID